MIYAKLLAFQKQNIALEKDGRNPHFNSDYTTLTEVLNKVKGPLNDLGIAIIQFPSKENEQYGLLTRLYDTEDDTYVEGFIPYLEATNAQKLGSNITYARRYSLIAMLGLGDADDDGNAASTTPPAAKTAVPKARVPAPHAQGPVERNDEPFTEPKVEAQTVELEDIQWDDLPFTDEDFNKK